MTVMMLGISAGQDMTFFYYSLRLFFSSLSIYVILELSLLL